MAGFCGKTYSDAMQGVAVNARELLGAKRPSETVHGENTNRCLIGTHRTLGAGRSSGTSAAKVVARDVGGT